jgi:hypothetical protein
MRLGLDGVTAFFADVIPYLIAANQSVLLYELPLLHPSMNEADYTFEYIANHLHDLLIHRLQIRKLTIIGKC